MLVICLIIYLFFPGSVFGDCAFLSICPFLQVVHFVGIQLLIVLLATPWTAALQAPLSMAVSRQEYWSGVPLPSRVLNVSEIQNLRAINENTSGHFIEVLMNRF